MSQRRPSEGTTMNGTVKLVFNANTLEDAATKARNEWRLVVDDPTASLPWDAEFEITSNPLPVGTDDRLMVVVEVQLDQTAFRLATDGSDSS